MRMPSPSQRGFTLVEMMVAVAITTLIVGMGYHAISTLRTTWERQQSWSIANRSAWQLAHRLSRELRTAMVPSEAGSGAEFAGWESSVSLRKALGYQDETEKTGEKLEDKPLSADGIRFPVNSVSHTAGGRGPGMVEYFVQRNAEGEVQGVARRAVPAGMALEAVQPRLIARSVVALHFSYLDLEGNWRAGWDRAAVLPRAVRIGVAVRVPGPRGQFRIGWFFTQVNLASGRRIPL